MRLMMIGTGPFAVPTFRELYNTHHQMAALVTAPMRWKNGRPIDPVSAMRDIAHEHGTPIFDPESINTDESRAKLASFHADLLVVCDYGQILSADTLAAVRLGGINLHGSLLPRYRGAAPINWAVYNGETETGVTVIHMTPRVDAGPCIGQASLAIHPEETAAELEHRLAEIGAWLTRRTIDSLEEGRIEALPQDPALASKAPRLKKTDGQIDWSRPASALKNMVRALEPWPKTYTFWHRSDGPAVRLILGPVDADDAAAAAQPPGHAAAVATDRLTIAAGQGTVAPRSIQPAGKRLLSITDFLRGYHVQVGDRFGPE